MTEWKCYECSKSSKNPVPCVLTVTGKEIRMPDSCIYQRGYPHFNPVWVRCEQEQVPSSKDLLLIAHDEWKRREERKRIHEEIPWVSGWISSYFTSKKFVHDKIKELRQGERMENMKL